MSRTKFIGITIATAAVLAVLVSLGNWQLDRLAWKENLLSTIQTRIQQAPRTLEAYLKSNLGEDYWPVSVTGVFNHKNERHFFATFEGQSGYYIYTPLEAAKNQFVFVNRGFVPFDKKDAANRIDGQTLGTVKITGLARSILLQKPTSQVPDNDVAKNIFYWKDFAAMKTSAGLPQDAAVLEVFVDADKSATPPSGFPVGGVTQIDLPNNHLSYAGTWYGLGAALFCIWIVMAWRQYPDGSPALT